MAWPTRAKKFGLDLQPNFGFRGGLRFALLALSG